MNPCLMIMNEEILMLDTVFAVIKKNRKIVKRAYPWSFIWSRVSGAFFSMAVPFLLYFFVFDKKLSTEYAEYSRGCTYLNYILLGAVLNVLSFSTLMSVGRCLITEQREGTLDNFLLSPASRTGYFIGAYIEQLGRSMLEAVFIIVFGILFGARLKLEYIPSIIVCIIFSSVAFFSVSILVSTIMLYTRDTYLVQNTLFLIMSCICGVEFPIEFFPKIIQYISRIFPLTYTINIIRACASGNFTYEIYRFDIIMIIVLILTLSLVTRPSVLILTIGRRAC